MDPAVNNLTVSQLKIWLQSLGQPTSGTKNMLVVRLSELSAEERGECPIVPEELSSIGSATPVQAENEPEADFSSYTAAQLREWLQRLGKSTVGNKSELVARLAELTNEERGSYLDDDEAESVNGLTQNNNESSADREINHLQREIALLKREKEVLAKENDLLQKMAQLNSGAATASTSASPSSVSNEISHGSLLNVTKDLLPEHDGTTSADVWI